MFGTESKYKQHSADWVIPVSALPLMQTLQTQISASLKGQEATKCDQQLKRLIPIARLPEDDQQYWAFPHSYKSWSPIIENSTHTQHATLRIRQFLSVRGRAIPRSGCPFRPKDGSRACYKYYDEQYQLMISVRYELQRARGNGEMRHWMLEILL